jgi:hypothetical protein
MALSSTEEKKTAAEIVAALDLQRHPDGGFYLETFRDPSIFLPTSVLPLRCKLHAFPCFIALPLSRFLCLDLVLAVDIDIRER